MKPPMKPPGIGRVAKLESRLHLVEEELKSLIAQVNRLEYQPKPVKVNPKGYTVKVILAELGKTGDNETGSMVRFLASKWYKKHGGEPNTTGGNGRQFEYYPQEVHDYIIATLNAMEE